MKQINPLFCVNLTVIFVFLLLPLPGSAFDPGKLLNRTIDRTERNIERRVERRVDRQINEQLDSVEDSIDGKHGSNQKQESTTGQTDPDSTASSSTPALSWSKFDFVPGDVVILEDNLAHEKNGEFPSKWDLVGGTVENARFGDDNVIYFLRTSSRQGIVPLIKDNQNDYLPDAFTVEFDAYFDSGVHNQTYYINFYDMKNQRRTMQDLIIYINKAKYGSSEGSYPGVHRGHYDDKAKWRRISISFNQRALKVYLDDTRVLNIPNISDNPSGITLRGMNPQGNYHSYLKNFRIAKGAVPLYDRYLTDGKIITNGIRFDVGKATIRPESMGVLNEVVQLMNDHPDLRFSVEGHTDSDGNAEFNQKLSEVRSRAVVEQMVRMGIALERLRSVGHGQTNPLVPNTSAEEKAQNRRVEFVKM